MPINPLTILNTSRSGLLARQFEIDTAAYNLANISTNGFRPLRADFQELVSTEVDPTLINGPYRGAAHGVTRISLTPGSLRPDSSPYSLAIDGAGFFQVTLPDGTIGYTRDGSFRPDADGALVSASGSALVWEGALPDQTERAHINPDGAVMAFVDEVWQQVGQIEIAVFENESGLNSLDGNVYLADEATGPAQVGAPAAAGRGRVLSGVVETSGARLADELTFLIIAQRAYSMALQAFDQTDEMVGQAIRLREG